MDKGSVTGQIIVLGFILILIVAVSDVTYALLSGKLGHWLKGNRGFITGRRYVAGFIYIGLGLAAALTIPSRF